MGVGSSESTVVWYNSALSITLHPDVDIAYARFLIRALS